jgi:AcrR family transcriptional regulator
MNEVDVQRRAPYGENPVVGARARRTHDRILGCALRVFERRGHREATIDDIARAARASRATVYQYFESKTEILVALSVRLSASVLEIAKEAPEVGPDEDGVVALRDWMGRILGGMLDYGPVLEAWADPSSGMSSLVEASDRFTRRFSRVAGERLMPDRPAQEREAIALTIFSMIDGVSTRVLHQDAGASADEVIDAFARIVHRGLYPAAAGRRRPARA